MKLHVFDYVHNRPWAILPEKLTLISQVVDRWARGERLSDEEMERFRAATTPTARQSHGVAVLPLYGIISHRANLLTEYSGGTSTEKAMKQFRGAVGNPNVGTIVLDVDSPGGTIDGVPELAAEIFAARGQKKIIAVANTLAASAAYWLASAADEVVVSPSGVVGSIGVYTMHEDVSALNEKLGVKPTVIKAGKYKAETDHNQPLTDDARAYLQDQVDAAYSMFTADVARHRGTTKKEVTDGYGQGRVVSAQQAVKIGLADRVATLDQVLQQLGVGQQQKVNVALERRRLALASAALDGRGYEN